MAASLLDAPSSPRYLSLGKTIQYEPILGLNTDQSITRRMSDSKEGDNYLVNISHSTHQEFRCFSIPVISVLFPPFCYIQQVPPITPTCLL